jgi:ferredoxin|tara:strand:- start:439 stop:762 length:324 start_codon:yes stop_codon:yes gene_type:complete
MNNEIEISVKDRQGKVYRLSAPTDMSFSLMDLFKIHELDVEGTCGGIAMCASCQCYVLSNHKLIAISSNEEAMLSEAFFLKEESRLGCQIKITNDLDGLQIELAPKE